LFFEKLTTVCAIIFVIFVILLTVANPDIWK
jgi:hypothetical protein